MWQDFSERTRVEDAAYKERTRRVQQEQGENPYHPEWWVRSREGRQLGRVSCRFAEVCRESAEGCDSIMRARRAYAFAERRGFEDVWRSDALDMADLLTMNVNGNEVWTSRR